MTNSKLDRTLSGAVLRAAVTDVLGAERYRTAAQHLASAVDRAGRGSRAVEELEALLQPIGGAGRQSIC